MELNLFENMETTSKYRSKQYWESRYSEEEHYEWFESAYTVILEKLSSYCKDIDGNYVHLGCGNSKLGIDLKKTHLINTDYSNNVIKKMSRLFEGEWSVMNILNLPIRDKVIDVIVDKGTLDALLCDVNLWNPEPDMVKEALQALSEIHRILCDDGVYIYATFGQPHFRKPLLKLANLEVVETITIGEAFHYFVYIIKKHKNKNCSS